MNEAVKFSVAFLENAELVLINKIFVSVCVLKVFSDSRIFVFSNALVKVSGCITNIIYITQITCKFVNNAMLTYNARLNFFRLKILFQFFCSQKLAVK